MKMQKFIVFVLWVLFFISIKYDNLQHLKNYNNSNFIINFFLEKTNILAYSLNNGTVGAYDEITNLWRIKVCIRLCSFAN